MSRQTEMSGMLAEVSEPAGERVTITIPRRDLRIVAFILNANANEWDPSYPENAAIIRHFAKKLKTAADKP